MEMIVVVFWDSLHCVGGEFHSNPQIQGDTFIRMDQNRILCYVEHDTSLRVVLCSFLPSFAHILFWRFLCGSGVRDVVRRVVVVVLVVVSLLLQV